MSDLTAANCGCNNGNGYNNTGLFGGNNSCIWIILLLLFCGGNGNGCGCGGNGLFGTRDGNGSSCCEWIILLLLLSSCCGGCNN